MSRAHRVKKLIILDIKKEIISKQESGKSVGDLSAEFSMAKSTIGTSLKNKEEIKSAQVYLYCLFCIIFFLFKWLCWMVTLL